MNHTAAYRVYRDTWDTDQPHTSYTVEIMRPDNQSWQRIAVADTRESALLAARLFLQSLRLAAFRRPHAKLSPNNRPCYC